MKICFIDHCIHYTIASKNYHEKNAKVNICPLSIHKNLENLSNYKIE